MIGLSLKGGTSKVTQPALTRLGTTRCVSASTDLLHPPSDVPSRDGSADRTETGKSEGPILVGIKLLSSRVNIQYRLRTSDA
jgi:hypothetical protein